MTANIKCSDCKDLTSSSSSWVYGALAGSALSSDSQSASISQHSSIYGTMSLDMTKAKNSANTNPFVTTGAATTSGGASDGCAQAESGSGTTNSGSTATSSGSSNGYPFGGGSFTGLPTDASGRFGSRPTSGSNDKRAAAATPSACVGGGSSTNSGASALKQTGWANPDTRTRILMSHGIIAGLAFVVLFPFGAIAIRLFSFPGLVAFHAACQTVGYLFWIIGFGLGVYIANKTHYVSNFSKPDI